MPDKWTFWDGKPGLNSFGLNANFARLFQNQLSEAQGAFRIKEPGEKATLLAREGIQNSWDSARERYKKDTEAGREPTQFSLKFKFTDLEDSKKETFIKNAGIDQLVNRANSVNEDIGVDKNFLEKVLDKDSPLTILEITEVGTTGMYGVTAHENEATKTSESKLEYAMTYLGENVNQAGDGGSYGQGKAGLINASRLRTIFAYTCLSPNYRFDHQIQEDKHTRRLLGMTYWASNKFNAEPFSGGASFDNGDGPLPFFDAKADSQAESLFMKARHPDDIEDIGTTLLVVAPTMNETELMQAVERYWWPAIVDEELSPKFEIEIEHTDGDRTHPRPRRDPVLEPFVQAFEMSVGKKPNIHCEPEDPESSKKFLPKVKIQQGHMEIAKNTGTLFLVSDNQPNGWQYGSEGQEDTEGDAIDDKNLIALIRTPRMVVQYYVASATEPYVRGVFIAANDTPDTEEANTLLRKTEPPLHDEWQKTAPEDADAAGYVMATGIFKNIKSRVSKFQKRIKVNVPVNREGALPEYDKIIGGLFGSIRGVKPPPPPPPPPGRKVSIQPGIEGPAEAEEVSKSRVKSLTSVKYGIMSDDAEDKTLEVLITVTFSILEDNKTSSKSRWPVLLNGQLPKNFSELEKRVVEVPTKKDAVTKKVVTGVRSADGLEFTNLEAEAVYLVGRFEKGVDHVFKFETESYDRDWSGQFGYDAQILGAEKEKELTDE